MTYKSIQLFIFNCVVFISVIVLILLAPAICVIRKLVGQPVNILKKTNEVLNQYRYTIKDIRRRHSL